MTSNNDQMCHGEIIIIITFEIATKLIGRSEGKLKEGKLKESKTIKPFK